MKPALVIACSLTFYFNASMIEMSRAQPLYQAQTLEPGATVEAYRPPESQFRFGGGEWSKHVYRYPVKKGDRVTLELRSNDFPGFLHVVTWDKDRRGAEEIGSHATDAVEFRYFASIAYTAHHDGNDKVSVKPSGMRSPGGPASGEYRLSLKINSTVDVEMVERAAPERNVYVAVATTLPSLASTRAARSWSYWTSWHSESPHEGRELADKKCRKERDSWTDVCNVESSIKSGCVALVEGTWYVSGRKREQQAGFMATSTFEHLVVGEATRSCEDGARLSRATSYQCTPIVKMCSREKVGR